MKDSGKWAVVFTVLNIILIVACVVLLLGRDRKAPAISFSQNDLIYYSGIDNEKLLQGVTAMDNYLEIIPDDSKKEMIFLGKESSSYKMGNIRLDLKSVLVALVDFVASLNKPETLFEYVQLVIISILCVGAVTKKELDYNCAVIVYLLHKRNAYESGITVNQVKAEINKMREDYQFEDFDMEKLEKDIRNLLKWNVIRMEEEKIYLNERVWGKIE